LLAEVAATMGELIEKLEEAENVYNLVGYKVIFCDGFRLNLFVIDLQSIDARHQHILFLSLPFMFFLSSTRQRRLQLT
jgi:hypothetical protein